MKVTKKLIPAIAMLVISAVTLSSASFAWFTMSKQVQVSQINLTATSADSLLIAKGTTKPVIGDYATSVAFDPFTGILVQSSSKTGVIGTFFTTNTPLAGGTIGDSTQIIAVETPDTAADAQAAALSGEVNGVFYVDADIWLLNTGSSDINVKVAANIAGTNIYKAVRVAVLAVGDADAESVPTLSSTSILAPTGYTTGYKAVTAAGIGVTAAALEDPTLYVADTAIFALPKTVAADYTAESEDAQHVRIRIWLEGQDASCISQFAGESFNVALEFSVID